MRSENKPLILFHLGKVFYSFWKREKSLNTMLSVDPIPWYVGQLPTNIVTTSFPLEEQIRWFVNQLKMRVADQIPSQRIRFFFPASE